MTTFVIISPFFYVSFVVVVVVWFEIFFLVEVENRVSENGCYLLSCSFFLCIVILGFLYIA